MEPLTVKTPADVLSFVGHALGFWPRESLVCITLADNHVGATLRVDLPKPSTEISYTKMVAGYLSHDTSAEGVLFAVCTSEPTNGDHKPHAATIVALTGALAERGLTVRESLLVGDQTVSQYDGDPRQGDRIPLSATQSSQINAEFVYCEEQEPASLGGPWREQGLATSWKPTGKATAKQRRSPQPEPVMSPTPRTTMKR